MTWSVEATAEVENALRLATAEISLLREYRTRLIADIVTGKLDVREAAGRLPDENEEVESLDEADMLPHADDEIPEDIEATMEVAEA